MPNGIRNRNNDGMKWVLILLTVTVVLGLITGIVLAISGEVAFTGVVWSITLILSCIARRIAIYRKRKGQETNG